MFLKHLRNSDIFLLKLFNNRIKCKPLDIIMTPITYLGSVAFTAAFCILTLFYPNDIIKLIGVRATLALCLSTLISQVLKINVNRLRPFLKINNLNIKKIGIDEYSFPSGHTTAAFSLAVTIVLSSSLLSYIIITFAALVGISRIYLGVHYPTDVIAGMILGSTCSWLIYAII